MPRPKDRKKLRKNREKRKVTYKETRFEITDFLSIKIKQKKKVYLPILQEFTSQ